jgi:NifB/MoaA-like Fe-S oxidoreductase
VSKAAVNRYTKKRQKAHTARIQAIKLAHGCADCGYRDDPAKLHFDHRPGTVKLGQVSQMFKARQEAVDAEIAKCDVRCASCHITRHNHERKAS